MARRIGLLYANKDLVVLEPDIWDGAMVALEKDLAGGDVVRDQEWQGWFGIEGPLCPNNEVMQHSGRVVCVVEVMLVNPLLDWGLNDVMCRLHVLCCV